MIDRDVQAGAKTLIRVFVSNALIVVLLVFSVPGFAQNSSPSGIVPNASPSKPAAKVRSKNRQESMWSQLGCDAVWSKIANRPHLSMEQFDKLTPKEREEYDRKYPPFTASEMSQLESCKRAAHSSADLTPQTFPSPYSVHRHHIQPVPPPSTSTLAGSIPSFVVNYRSL